MSAFLTSDVTELRWLVLALSLANLAWSVPAAMRGVRGNVSAECGFAIAWTAVFLGMAGYQIGYLFQSVPYIEHWSKTVDLMLIALGEILALVAWWIRTLEIERRRGRTTLLRRLYKRFRA